MNNHWLFVRPIAVVLAVFGYYDLTDVCAERIQGDYLVTLHALARFPVGFHTPNTISFSHDSKRSIVPLYVSVVLSVDI